MSLKYSGFLLLGGLLLARPLSAAVEESTSTATMPGEDIDQTTSSEESEAKGIIPENAETVRSTQPVTPISLFPEKSAYEQAKAELIRAYDLWHTGHFEAASDTALEAYDDFISIRRVPGVKRSVIRSQTHQAAGIYVEAGITYIKSYVKQAGNTPEAIEEGKGRLEDLRDVARGYPELRRMLQNATEQISKSP